MLLQHQQQQKDLSDWLVVLVIMKAVWKCIMKVNGAQCVMIAGTKVML